MAPKAKTMAQFMEAGGLDRLGPLAWADQDFHQRFQLGLGLLAAAHLLEAEQGAAVAGPTPLQRRPPPPEAQLGIFGPFHPLQADLFPPAGQGRLHRLAPALAPKIRGAGLHPDAPVGQGHPAQP